MHIKIAAEDLNGNLPQSEHKSIQVELSTRRGDDFLIQKVDHVLCDGKDILFTVPDGARLIVSTPTAIEELVYDKAQGAAIRRSSQENDGDRADRAWSPEEQHKHEERRVADQKNEVGTQGLDTRSPGERAANPVNQVPPPGTRVLSAQEIAANNAKAAQEQKDREAAAAKAEQDRKDREAVAARQAPANAPTGQKG